MWPTVHPSRNIFSTDQIARDTLHLNCTSPMSTSLQFHGSDDILTILLTMKEEFLCSLCSAASAPIPRFTPYTATLAPPLVLPHRLLPLRSIVRPSLGSWVGCAFADALIELARPTEAARKLDALRFSQMPMIGGTSEEGLSDCW